jgi:hypothetical protein
MLAIVMASVAQLPTGNAPFLSPGPAHAQDDWRREFDSICAKTQDADTFSPQELKELISRCDALKSRVEKLEESPRKVALKRLQMCKDLFVYILQSKENNR